MFTDARISATKPSSFDVQLAAPMSATETAISAPTTITEEIAFVTAISGVCKAGVTLQTTK